MSRRRNVRNESTNDVTLGDIPSNESSRASFDGIGASDAMQMVHYKLTIIIILPKIEN